MIRYRYQAYDGRGVLVTGALDSISREAALAALVARGEHAIAIEEAGGAEAASWWQGLTATGMGLRDADRLAFTRELSSLIKADLPVDEALAIMVLQPGLAPRVKAATVRLREGVREGLSLSRALAAEGASFPEYYWRAVAAGESAGAIAEVLSELTQYMERSADVRSKVGAALAYPLLLLVTALAAVCVVTLVLIPSVMPLFADAGVSPPLLLSALAAIQAFVREHALALAGAGLLLAAALAFAATDVSLTLARDKAALRLPLLGGLIETRETARLTRILATLLKNGVALLDALRSAGPAMGNSVYNAAIAEAAGRIAEGSSLSKELASSGLFGELAVRLAGVGEKTGQLDVMLMRAAEIHEAALMRRFDRLTRMLGPALTLVAGLMAGGLILSVMNAILSINDLALR